MITAKARQKIIFIALVLTLIGLGMVLAGFIGEVFFGIKMAGALGAVLIALPTFALICSVVVVLAVLAGEHQLRFRRPAVFSFESRWSSRSPSADRRPPRRRPRR
ncbi:hypothetical protein ISN34_07920 [Xanthomonas translucens pv. translucens]|uniref:Uncharacterized protein n=1 Tax=Xanthomonas translucens pv. translucens TaxID=134875 RepID=A0ABW9L1F9_XANCT|nr:hypothetical protein [Xanthomonas translucens]QSQ35842.1 hypothetical protein ISN31_10195 [Xanthomonas translucens pv. translucens]QSQ46750.1 hypothetical protein ISN34_07920 [Xanthomonas translucens pv. translucens]